METRRPLAITRIAASPAAKNDAAVGRAATASDSRAPAPAAAQYGKAGHVSSQSAAVRHAATIVCPHNIWLAVAHIEVASPNASAAQNARRSGSTRRTVRKKIPIASAVIAEAAYFSADSLADSNDAAVGVPPRLRNA